MRYRGTGFALAIVVCVLGLIAVQGCEDATQVVQPPANDESAQRGEQETELILTWAASVGGDWTAEVTVTKDTCGIGVGSPFREIDMGQHGKQLDLFPLDATSDCSSFPILMTGIEGRESYPGVANDAGDELPDEDTCVVRFFSVFSAEFRSQEFVATEETEISYVSGDCGEFTTGCEWFLEATAEKCTDCGFVCDADLTGDPSRIGGPLGWPVEIDLTSLTNEPE